MINAETLYDIYRTTEERKAPDLTVGLAMLRADRPGITDEEDREMCRFIGRHSRGLAQAYPDKEKFAAAVAEGVREDEEAARRAAEAMSQ